LLFGGPQKEILPPILPSSEVLPLKELERRHIEKTLALLDNNYSDVAKKLGVSRSTLWRKIREYGIERPFE
jgi:DNA-binding NtrC family response regulator